MIKKAKNYIILVFLAVVSILAVIFLGRKPAAVKQKEKEIEVRQKVIKKHIKESKSLEQSYKEIVQEHNDEIKKAGENIEKKRISSVDSAAHYIDDILSNNGPE